MFMQALQGEDACLGSTQQGGYKPPLIILTSILLPP